MSTLTIDNVEYPEIEPKDIVVGMIIASEASAGDYWVFEAEWAFNNTHVILVNQFGHIPTQEVKFGTYLADQALLFKFAQRYPLSKSRRSMLCSAR